MKKLKLKEDDTQKEISVDFLDCKDEYFVNNGIGIYHIGEDKEPMFGMQSGPNKYTYSIVQKIFDKLEYNKNIVAQHIDKLHVLYYWISEEKYLRDGERKLSNIISNEKLEDLTINKYIVLGYVLITYHTINEQQYSKIHLFDTFIRGYNLGMLLLSKFIKMKEYNCLFFPCEPIEESFEYWLKVEDRMKIKVFIYQNIFIVNKQ